jgi:hypothetical protein
MLYTGVKLILSLSYNNPDEGYMGAKCWGIYLDMNKGKDKTNWVKKIIQQDTLYSTLHQ